MKSTQTGQTQGHVQKRENASFELSFDRLRCLQSAHEKAQMFSGMEHLLAGCEGHGMHVAELLVNGLESIKANWRRSGGASWRRTKMNGPHVWTRGRNSRFRHRVSWK